MLQVYDRRKRLKRTMHLLEPIFSISFLNDKGDIVAALAQKLVVIRADSYALLTAEEMAMLVTEHTKPQQLPLNAGPMQPPSQQLVSSSSSKRLALARQQTLAQVIQLHCAVGACNKC